MRTLARRLALFLPSLDGGGAERVMLNLARGFLDEGHPVDLVLARAQGGAYAKLVPPEARLVDLRAGRTLAATLPLARHLRRARPAAVLSTLEHANLVALWARRASGVRARAVVRVANTITPSSEASPHLRGRLTPRLVRRFYPWADRIVANSRGSAEDVERVLRAPPGSVRVVPNPVVTPRLLERARARPDHPWFHDGGPPVIVAAGRLAPQKDFPTLLRAMARLRAQRPARLLVLGEGGQRAELEAMARGLGLEKDVSLPGFVPDPYPCLGHARLFVLSSRWEGSPNALIEAMACGAPVVSTDCPSGPREILRDGLHGPLVPVGDDEAMAEAMARMLDRPVRAPPEALAPYHAKAVVAAYLDELVGAR